MYEKLKGYDVEGYTKTQVLTELKELMYDLSEDMGETGFLDTRLFDDKETEVSEDLENFFLDKKPAIYDR
jgi:abortive infection bacteriophage resistance protein